MTETLVLVDFHQYFTSQGDIKRIIPSYPGTGDGLTICKRGGPGGEGGGVRGH